MSCNLDKDAKLLFGHYGSKTIVSIKDKHVYKYFPIMLHYLENEHSIKKWNQKIESEIYIFKKLTEKIVDKDISPHIVKILKIKTCKNKPKFYKNCILDDFKDLFHHNHEYSYCDYVDNFPKFKIESPMMIIQLEYCNHEFIDLVSFKYQNESIHEFIMFLNQIIFQIIFTLQVITDTFPKFIHKDLFIKNILCVKNKTYKNKYIRYHYKNIIFDIPSCEYTSKINDFGISQIDDKHGNIFQGIPYNLLKDNYKDHFTFLFDLFNHIHVLIKKKKSETNDTDLIDNYFNKFLDINAIYDIRKHTDLKWLLYSDSITEYKGFIQFIKLKSRYQILKDFKHMFKYDESHDIIHEYNS